MAAGVTQGSVLVPIFCSLHMNDTPASPGTHLADDTCIYATEKYERCVLCKVQRGLTAVNSWCELSNIKINEGKTQAIYFSKRLIVHDDVLQLKGRDIPFVNNITYLGVTFDRRKTWRHHIERTVAKTLWSALNLHTRTKQWIKLINSKFFWRWCTTLGIPDFLVLCSSSANQNNTTFQKLDLFPSSGESMWSTSVGSVRKSWHQSLGTVNMKMSVLWHVALCNLVHTYQGFGRIYCFHLQGCMFFRKVSTTLPDYTLPEDYNMNLQRRENLKSWKLYA
jgi:hypothetical protein